LQFGFIILASGQSVFQGNINGNADKNLGIIFPEYLLCRLRIFIRQAVTRKRRL